MSDDSASSLDFEPARKKQRLGPKGLPETMQPRKSKGTVSRSTLAFVWGRTESSPGAPLGSAATERLARL